MFVIPFSLLFHVSSLSLSPLVVSLLFSGLWRGFGLFLTHPDFPLSVSLFLYHHWEFS